MRSNSNGLWTAHGQKVYFCHSHGYPIVTWLERQLGMHSQWSEGGPFTTNMCLEVVRRMGCNPIIFLGLDFSTELIYPLSSYDYYI